MAARAEGIQCRGEKTIFSVLVPYSSKIFELSLVLPSRSCLHFAQEIGDGIIIQQALKQSGHEATVLLYPPGIDPFFEDLTRVQIEYSALRTG
ncbi:MAG: hypothetical protein LUQ22_07440 [Methanotrichaceae archaeon]|nr:hypothetical protein [Methanotrichaceae archaeon]